MKKSKQPGENISLKTKKTEDPAVMQWINSQTNLMDSLRYLIEKEIAQNGVRNLQMFVPAERSGWQPAAAASDLPDGPAPLPHSFSHAAAAEAPDRAEPEPGTSAASSPGEDEIDDDDIESWI